MKILLMGYMGCGKSTIGKLLACELLFRFIDIDTQIEETEKQTIDAIFNTKGEKYFRMVERKILLESFRENNVVIACGGGAPCYSGNMKLIHENSVSFYLKMDYKQLHARLAPIKMRKTRPLLKNFSTDELLNYIRAKISEREKFYAQANYSVEVKNKSKKKIVEEIMGRYIK